MEWIVEFEGRQTQMDAVRSTDFDRIVGPLKSMAEKALNKAADPDGLDGLSVVVFAEDDGNAPTGGFKFEGSPTAANYAVFLTGEQAPIVKPTH